MAVLMVVLKILGAVLLAVFLAILLMALFVLFIPFGYSVSGGIDDPSGSTELLHLNPKKDVTFSGEFRWLMGALRLRASYEGAMKVQISFLGITVPLSKLLQILRRKKQDTGEKEKRPPEEKKKKSLEEKIEGAVRRVERLLERLDDAVGVLESESGRRARQVLFERIRGAVRRFLPRKWEFKGVVGLGDPARSAKVFAVQGILYPVIYGHVDVGVEYDLYRFDLRGSAQGQIRVVHLVYAGLRIILNKNIRRVLARLRRGPQSGVRRGAAPA